jgi:hypothetical protein
MNSTLEDLEGLQEDEKLLYLKALKTIFEDDSLDVELLGFFLRA